jgi:hypothetical protein
MSEEQVTEVSEAQDFAQEEVAQSGVSTEDWRTAIPEEIRDHKSLSHINDIGALAKSYVHAQQMIGADKVVIPGRSATDDEWNEFYTRIGRPESPENYNLSLESLPEGVEADEGMLGWFSETAHKAGMTPQQAQVMLDAYNQLTGESLNMTSQEAEMKVANVEQELRSEFGQAFDDKLAIANGVLSEFSNPDIAEIQLADGTLLGDNPEVIRLLANVGTYITERVGEDSLEGVRTSGALTPDSAMDKVRELTEKNSPYWDARHPEHQYFVNEVLKYREAAQM